MINKNMEIVGVSQVLKKLSSVASTTPTSSLMKQSQIEENDDRLMDNNITINPSNDLNEQCGDNKKLAAESECPKCGFFNWKPDFLQKFMTIRYCLLFLCLAGAVQGSKKKSCPLNSVTFNIFQETFINVIFCSSNII